MKKILLLTISLFCILVSTVSTFADENNIMKQTGYTDTDAIYEAKGFLYDEGDIVYLPMAEKSDGTIEDIRCLVVDKNSQKLNSITLLTLDPVVYTSNQNIYNAQKGSGVVGKNSTEMYYNGQYEKGNANYLDYGKSSIVTFENSYVSFLASKLKKNFTQQMTSTNRWAQKTINDEENSATFTSKKLYFPSLNELGFTSAYVDSDSKTPLSSRTNLANEGEVFGLFKDGKNLFDYLDEEESFSIWTRTNSLDGAVNGAYQIVKDGDNKTITNAQDTASYRFCFTITTNDIREVTSDENCKVTIESYESSSYIVTLPKTVVITNDNYDEDKGKYTASFSYKVGGDFASDKKVYLQFDKSATIRDPYGYKKDVKITVDVPDVFEHRYDKVKQNPTQEVTLLYDKTPSGRFVGNLPVKIWIE